MVFRNTITLIRPALLGRASVCCKRALATDNTALMPWFVDQEYENPQRSIRENAAPSAPPPPEDAPEAVKLVHAALSRSAHLDLSTLVTSRAKEIPLGPPLPLKAPQGRRKRGSTYAGESMFDVPGSIWSWTVVAQVGVAPNCRGTCPENTNRSKQEQKIEEPLNPSCG